MSINLSKFETTIQTFANNVTIANTTTDFLNIAKAIQFSSAGQMLQYSNASDFPLANTASKQFAQDINSGAIYFSNGTSWTPVVGDNVVQSLNDASSTTGIYIGELNTIANTITATYTLAESQTGYNLFVTGSNYFGELGLGDNYNRYVPTAVGSSDWKQFSPNSSGGVSAIKTDGTLWSWGNNYYGQLGLGDSYNYSSPVQVGALTNWKQVGGSSTNTAAIKNDGTLWAWGGNFAGQLGLGDNYNYSSPVQVGALTNWKQVSCGYSHTAAIKTNGTLWTWGNNNYGQLGLGDTTNYSSPVQVGTLANWKQVSAGNDIMAATKTDGTLWTWGNNNYGQLGLGNTTNYSSPVQVGSLTNWKQVSNGQVHMTAIKTDGTLWASGINDYGQLGLGDTTNYSSPVQVGSLTNWKQVVAGAYSLYSAAIKTDGTLWSWGNNDSGRLGLGDSYNYSSPVQVGALTNWKQVAGGVGLIAQSWPISSGYFPVEDDGIITSTGTLYILNSDYGYGGITIYKNTWDPYAIITIDTNYWIDTRYLNIINKPNIEFQFVANDGEPYTAKIDGSWIDNSYYYTAYVTDLSYPHNQYSNFYFNVLNITI